MDGFLSSASWVKQIEQRIVVDNDNISFEEAVLLYKITQNDPGLLYNLAHNIQSYYFENFIDLCSIFPAKIGLCPEDCKFCSQSIHNNCKIEIKNIVSVKEVIEYVESMLHFSVKKISLVASGRQLNESDFQKVLEICSYVSKKYDIFLCASLGFLTRERAKKLLQAGVKKYHNNLETSSCYFPNICSTHTQKQKIATLQIAKETGLEICSGGIIAMGENMIERIRLAFELRELDVNSVPVNILNPIQGTPLENVQGISVEEILTTIALFRIILPRKTIILAGGKENALKNREIDAYAWGANGCMVGNYLTTRGLEIPTKLDILRNRYKLLT